MGSAASSALDAVRALVPAWVDVVAVAGELACWTLGAWFAASGLAWLGARAARRAQAGGWHQVARAAFPYRVGLGLLQGGVPITWYLAHLFGEPPLAPGARLAAVPAAAAAWGVLAVKRLRFERRLGRANLTGGDWVRGQLLSVLLFFPHLAVAILVGLFVPPRFDAVAFGVLAAGVAAMVIAGWGGGLAVARVLGIVRPPSPRTAAAIERSAGQVGRAVPRIGEVSVSMANALVVFGAETILVTRRALEVLGDEELVAVLRHELGHLAEPVRSRAIHFAGIAVVAPLAAARPIHATLGYDALLLILLVALIVGQLLLPVHRRREEDADRCAFRSAADSAVFARALEAIHRVNLIPAVLTKGQAMHPHLYDRLIAADVTPAFPRPAPPAHGSPVLLTMLGYGVFLACAFLGSKNVPLWIGALGGEQARLWCRAVVEQTYPAYALNDLARSVWQSDGPASAIPFYAAAAELDDSPWWPALAAQAAAAGGRPDDAATFLDEARGRARSHGPGSWDDAVRAAADALESARKQREALRGRSGPGGPILHRPHRAGDARGVFWGVPPRARLWDPRGSPWIDAPKELAGARHEMAIAW
jgi:Zn-dependent protease with chaperone function